MIIMEQCGTLVEFSLAVQYKAAIGPWFGSFNLEKVRFTQGK